MNENTIACACGHLESDHSTQAQIELGYPTGCTAVVADSPDPAEIDLCGAERSMTGRMRWARQSIDMATTDGPHPVEADVYGAWAVHEPYRGCGPIYIAWVVTHVPTGLSLGTGFEKSRAKKLCQQLHRIVGDTPITGAGLPGIEPEMRRQILRAVNIAHGYSEAEAEPPLPRAGATTR